MLTKINVFQFLDRLIDLAILPPSPFSLPPPPSHHPSLSHPRGHMEVYGVGLNIPVAGEFSSTTMAITSLNGVRAKAVQGHDQGIITVLSVDSKLYVFSYSLPLYLLACVLFVSCYSYSAVLTALVCQVHGRDVDVRPLWQRRCAGK